MFAAAIHIDAGVETNVRAVVVSDNGFGAVLEKLRAWERIFFRIPFLIAFEMDFLKTIRRIVRCSAMR